MVSASVGGFEVLLWLAVCLSKHDFSATNFSPPATRLFILSPMAPHEYSWCYLIVEEGHTIFSLSYFILQPPLLGTDFPFCRCGRIDHVSHLFYSFLSIHCRKCGKIALERINFWRLLLLSCSLLALWLLLLTRLGGGDTCVRKSTSFLLSIYALSFRL